MSPHISHTAALLQAADDPTAATAARTTPPPPPARTLLGVGAAAGPLYVAVATAQVLTREGFDIRHHAVSLLSNGELGWIQISTFVVTGLLTIAGAVGLGRVLRGGRGAVWAPRLVAVYGVSLIGAGAFVADPMNGFPVGSTELAEGTISGQGLAHLAVGGIGFLALVSACLILARRFVSEGRGGWAAASLGPVSASSPPSPASPRPAVHRLSTWRSPRPS